MLFSLGGKLNRGVSTIELMVTIAIFVLISTAVLVSYPQLSSQLSLDKTAQDIASTLHETRMYGIGIRSTGTGVNRAKGYGVHFDSEAENSANSYTLFSETEGTNDKRYASDNSEKVLEYKINARERIKDVCVLNSDDTGGSCDVAGAGLHCLTTDSEMKSVDIFFQRPAPSVFINGYLGSSGISVCEEAGASCAQAVVVIKSPNDKCKKIQIWTTGQVAIKSQTP